MIRMTWGYVDGTPKAKMDLDIKRDSIDELTDFFREVAKPKQEN